MSELNVYNVSNFSYDFSQTPSYLSKTGFDVVLGPDTFLYQVTYETVAASMIFLINGLQGTETINVECIDENDQVILGSSELIISDPVLKIKYTFENPIPAQSYIKYKFNTSGFLSQEFAVNFCNATITIV